VSREAPGFSRGECHSFVAFAAFVAYALVISPSLTGPANAAFTAAEHNFLFLWAAVFVPAAILTLILLGRTNPEIWRLWSGRLLMAGMLGLLVSALYACSSINTIVPTPPLPTTWVILFITASADVLVVGLILLPRATWRRWGTWLWVIGLLAFVLSASYQALAAIAPALRVGTLIQAGHCNTGCFFLPCGHWGCHHYATSTSNPPAAGWCILTPSIERSQPCR
jgi:hypothetical protein